MPIGTRMRLLFAMVLAATVVVSCSRSRARSGSAAAVAVGDSMATDSMDPRPFIAVHPELGAGLRTSGELHSGNWFGVGDIHVNGTIPPGYAYLPSGHTYVVVRDNAGTMEAGLLNGATFATATMVVSAADTRPGLTSDAKIWKISGTTRIYLCYTCDKKACCPTNTTVSSGQNQLDAESIAGTW